jgi:hypothetical protein
LYDVQGCHRDKGLQDLFLIWSQGLNAHEQLSSNIYAKGLMYSNNNYQLVMIISDIGAKTK